MLYDIFKAKVEKETNTPQYASVEKSFINK